MINRRLIRIKVFKLLFSRIHADERTLTGAGEELLRSFDKTMELYYLLLALPVSLKKYGIAKMEAGLKKFHPTPQEAHPNRRFVENKVVDILEADKAVWKPERKKSLPWSDHSTFLRKLYDDLNTRPWFIAYMELEQPLFKDDLALIHAFYQNELEDNEALNELLEDQNLYWADELAYLLGVILKTLGTIRAEEPWPHPQMFKQEEDKNYALRLLELSLLHYDEYVELLNRFALHWDLERMATTDVCLIVLGIAEVLHFPSIPVKVTINEVVEVAKYYSTPNSKIFVNGVLDKIVQHLKEEGRIVKEGRGLVDS
ncbi:MAG: transcription antitermination factor NusB [Bacteroidetes bacterium]|nr:transcription antitermination factor NusB [Bacteroidota bacterium]